MTPPLRCAGTPSPKFAATFVAPGEKLSNVSVPGELRLVRNEARVASETGCAIGVPPVAFGSSPKKVTGVA